MTTKEFPSPLGASYFRILHLRIPNALYHRLFPSPLGASYFRMAIAIDALSYVIVLVSVPSRGILFPNYLDTLEGKKLPVPRFRPLSGHLISELVPSENSLKWLIIVSVPSRGILFPNCIWLHYRKKMFDIKFPSPLGASYFRISDRCYRAIYIRQSFRPLSGHLISESFHDYACEDCFCVSVPSRGILFPNLFK